MSTEQFKILCVDDSREIIMVLVEILTKEGFVVYSASEPSLGLSIAKKMLPDLILLDIMLPEMNGYEVCRELQKDPRTAQIPVVFISALGQPQNKVSALAVGGVDYLTKPFNRVELCDIVRKFSDKKAAAGACPPAPKIALPQKDDSKTDYTLADFKISVIDKFKLSGAVAKAVTALPHEDIYRLADILGLHPWRVARMIADFAKCRYFPVINPDDVKTGVLPEKFLVQNNIAAINGPGGGVFLVMGHPFNFELYEMIRGIMCGGFEFGITEPSNISLLRRLSEERDGVTQKLLGVEVMEIEEAVMNRLRISAKTAKNEINEPNIKYLSNKILQFLVGEKGSEVRIEAVDAGYIVKVGPPGAMEEFTRFTRMTGNTVVARLKALASMDLVERRKSQNGSFSVVWRSERYDLHLRTEVDDCGETLVLSLAA